MKPMTIGTVLARGKWRTEDDPYLRARMAEERGARLEAETARKLEEKRALKEAEVRRAAERFGFVEYLPAGGESVEELEALRKTIWRKGFREYPYVANPKLLLHEMELMERLQEQWQAREDAKAKMFEE